MKYNVNLCTLPKERFNVVILVRQNKKVFDRLSFGILLIYSVHVYHMLLFNKL